MKRIEEISQIATENTSKALEKLTSKEVDAKLYCIKEIDIKEISNIFPPEQICAGIYMDISGDIKGRVLLLFSKDVCCNLCDTLLEKEHGATRELNELDKATLKEVANIIAGNYLSTLSNILQTKMVEGLPFFGYGSSSALLEQMLAPILQKPQRIFIIELEIIFPKEIFKGYIFLFFTLLAHKAIMDILKETRNK